MKEEAIRSQCLSSDGEGTDHVPLPFCSHFPISDPPLLKQENEWECFNVIQNLIMSMRDKKRFKKRFTLHVYSLQDFLKGHPNTCYFMEVGIDMPISFHC